ncbi:MAG: hypothetical protein R6V50_02995 [Thermoplasmatota archaeon]
MRKITISVIICVLLCSMMLLPSFSAEKIQPNQPIQHNERTIQTPSLIPEYDGTFIGGIGEIYQENGNWSYDTHGYLAGVYKQGRKVNRLFGHIFDLNEEQIGIIKAIFFHKIIIGQIEDMQENSAPIIGFLFYNDVHFVGRIMSFFGPAPHIWGEYTPN